ncbi:MAG: hypothetical protein K2K75_10540 [Muribaculaceae bacterium]|nr:hypothetical protein [Muribaculaceae bacterium]
MRFVVILLLYIVSINVCIGQDNRYAHLSSDFVRNQPLRLPEDMIRTDLNGDTISVLIVRSEIDDLTFDGNVFGEPIKNYLADGIEYRINLLKGSKDIRIRSNDFHQVVIDFPYPIRSMELWEVNVKGVTAPEIRIAETGENDNTYAVTIFAEPFVQLYIDEDYTTGSYYNNNEYLKKLEEGAHYITSKYKDYEYSQKVNVKGDGQEIDAKVSGSVTVYNASQVEFKSIQSPEANYISGGGRDTYNYDGMLGRYVMIGKPNSISFGTVEKTINVAPRTHQIFRLDEMVRYGFILYHGTNLQPFGFNLSGCKDWGFYLSYCADAKSKINTTYGESDFYDSDNGNQTHTIRSTSMTLSAGPMFRLWHKLYLQIGPGWAYYLSTSEPKVLTADYEYKSGLSLNAELFFRIKAFMMGVGYMRQFVKDAYNPNISNQLSFSVGIAFGG